MDAPKRLRREGGIRFQEFVSIPNEWRYPWRPTVIILTRLGWLHLDRTLGIRAHVIGSNVMVAALILAMRLLLYGGRDEAVEA